ncbi:aminotransferase class I/II-fold pyridoxal phosphate-dependent enzyme [Amycolatopsis sp. PS_44_ISF1]|uniref:pyridoxal phosphate-dependent decarboxylase family protein n=1 Tax=Amycolatopsis sp. PS_44_ISF1 TaxID=2974917 RepID=UPI0028DE800A|nr:aminotransferase class I/II-fold pyridoxal phosphate-dependent enzyme [Amycolatopsis sp. PS_44_ISF1]MDT8915250.1 pyridoxal-dependent decarboxylase [Amycolatopsis sp. PS_44_ISF1]
MLDHLEPDGHELRALLEQVTTGLAGFVDGLPQAPVDGRGTAPEIVDLVAEPPGESPGDVGKVLSFALKAGAAAIETASPRFFGYVPGGGLVSSAVGELMARVLNRFTAIGDFAPGLVALEHGVLTWLGELFGLPAGATGILTSGGSAAMLSMVVAAREDRLGPEADPGTARLYVSDQTHYCVAKAAHVAGFPARSVRLVATSDGRRLDPVALAAAIEQDRAAGLRPFLVVGTAGTTNAGAVDPLAAIAGVAREHRLWFHVDACYGGFFQLTARGRARFEGIGEADSITVDPHKSLFLPYGTGALLVRERRLLAASYPGDRAAYLPDVTGETLPDYAHLGFELTREHRGLRIWLPLHLHGVAAFRRALDEKLDLAGHLHEALAALPGLELPHPPELSTVVFRLRDGDEDANRALLERIRSGGRVLLSGTRLDGRFTLRLCVLSPLTHREHIDEAVAAVRAALHG